MKDPEFLEYMACEPCLISEEWPATTHHVREFGSPKNDRRTIRLALRYHIEGAGPHSIEKLGKRKFEAFHGINIEVEIARYNQQYEEQRV